MHPRPDPAGQRPDPILPRAVPGDPRSPFRSRRQPLEWGPIRRKEALPPVKCPFPRRWRLPVLALLLAAGLTACAKEDGGYVEKPVEDLYNTALDTLLEEDYVKAATAFDEVERQHPYSVWAARAQLMAAYTHYLAGNFDDAVIAADRYVQLHPGNPDAAYAYYLKAISHYERISDVGRDQSATRDALAALEEVQRRFPDSRYARDARLKADLARDHLAGKEMSVGRFYLKSGHMLAAIERFRVVIDRYQTTSHVPEALHRLVEAYTAVGLTGQARTTAAVLGHNYPGGDWYADSYGLVEGGRVGSAGKGWFARLGDWFLDSRKTVGGPPRDAAAR